MWYRYVLISEMDPILIKQKFIKMGVSVINPLENWELVHNYLYLNRSNFPNAENISNKTISVPIYPSLNASQIEYVKDAIMEIY